MNALTKIVHHNQFYISVFFSMMDALIKATGPSQPVSYQSVFFTGCHTKVKEPSLPYYLPIAEGRIVGYIPFSRVSALCEMLTALSRF